MSNEDGSIWITYNGELYNELELRKELLAKGHRYRTVCDTESLVHLYEEEGLEFVRRLNGMFALAIWDGNQRRLVLARDRMGQKPLFYGELPGSGLAFGSEPKAILASSRHRSRKLDRASNLIRYLFYEYVPAPYSIWGSLRKLPRGHVLSWESESIRIVRYWEPANRAAPPGGSTSTRRPTNSGEALRDSVARHRRSDVADPAFFLSGGIDSSSVAAAALQKSSRRGKCARSRSVFKIRASTRAVTLAQSRVTWEPTTTNEPFRSRPCMTCCPKWPAGSMSRSVTRRFCRLTC